MEEPPGEVHGHPRDTRIDETGRATQAIALNDIETREKESEGEADDPVTGVLPKVIEYRSIGILTDPSECVLYKVIWGFKHHCREQY